MSNNFESFNFYILHYAIFLTTIESSLLFFDLSIRHSVASIKIYSKAIALFSYSAFLLGKENLPD